MTDAAPFDAGEMPDFLNRLKRRHQQEHSMPKSAKLDSKSTVHQDEPAPEARPASTNGFDGKKLKGFLDRFRACQREIDTIMSAAQDECAPHRDDMAAIKKEAAEAGFSKTEFATVLRKMRLEDKLNAVAAKLDEDQQNTYEMMLHALGQLADTPLGAAAAASFDARSASN